MWIILVVPRLDWKERERCGQFKTKRWNCGACKKLMGEGGESLRCLDSMQTLEIGQKERKVYTYKYTY
nr:hypothetical protein [Tanacetum cinerariifolium]